MTIAEGLQLLHQRCSIFTDHVVAEALLDAIGWVQERDLADLRLLEPACGAGALLVPAARRLFRSARERGRHNDEARLSDCLVGFEIDAATVDAAREQVAGALTKEGARRSMARRLAKRWIRQGDFLLQPREEPFTHVAANPPYLRWSRIPTKLRKLYEHSVPRHAARGDLSLAFLHRSLELLGNGGTCSFLFPDRWLRSQYGEEFRSDLTGKASLVAHIEAHELAVFAGVRKVETYPAVSVFRVGSGRNADTAFHRPRDVTELADLCRKVGAVRPRIGERKPLDDVAPLGRAGGAIVWDREAQTLVADICGRLPSLSEAGVSVRCGTALGVQKAFVLSDPSMVEVERVVPFVRSADIRADGTVASSAWLANPWDAEGALVDLAEFPLLARRLATHRIALEARVCVRNEREWYRTIDKIRPEAVHAEKILVAGLANVARMGLSLTPSQPGNALYALRSTTWPLPALCRLLRAGAMEVFAQVLAPRMRNGSKRYDGYFLNQLRIPHWDDLTDDQLALLETEGADEHDIVAGVYRLRRSAVSAILNPLETPVAA